MGDFCVSGFFSRVPIKRGETPVLQAIMDSYDKLTSYDDEDDDTYEEDI